MGSTTSAPTSSSNNGTAPTTATSSSSSPPRSFIEAENRSHAVVVWSKSYCPYCTQTKELFRSLDVSDVAVHELDRLPGPRGRQLQEELHRMTGQRSVPNVFVRNRHVGGNDDTHRAHRSGELARLLRAS